MQTSHEEGKPVGKRQVGVRYIDNKLYVLKAIFVSREQANSLASEYKKKGYYVRVTTSKKGSMVWISKKPMSFYRKEMKGYK